MSKVKFPSFIIGAMRLGSWGANMSTIKLESFVNDCIDLGFNAFDHADIYGDYTTENDFGKVLKFHSSLRSNIHLITKCGIRKVCTEKPDYSINSYDSSYAHIIESVDKSLTNFNTDYIDTLLIHRPDYLMEVDEIAKAFEHLRKDGKVKWFGVSNFSTSQFGLLNDSIDLITNQIEVSLLNTQAFENGTLDQSIKEGIRPMAWSPLAGGQLFNGSNEESVKRILEVSSDLCEYYSCELDQLLYAWVLRHPANIIPVTGTSNIDRLKSAKKALTINLEKEHWYILLQAARGESVP